MRREFMSLYEILVPCKTNEGRPIRKRQHKEWDSRVRRITGGLTVLPTTKGQWIDPTGRLFEERMIPVRVAASASQMEEIADLTAKFYEQKAIMFYQVSSTVIIKHYE